ncbi:MAG: SCO family protein [Anaerolineae bacterium]|nr:SCO family protein [Anaerolineae bacterium]NUQ05677.1 SCO family protein [Anaerolineae bacterium]
MVFKRASLCLAALAAALLTLAACGATASSIPATVTPEPEVETPAYLGDLRGAVFDPPRPISDFTFASTTGESFTLSEHRGELILIYFGYRSCPDFCPTTFAELKRVYAALNEPADRLKIVFVTVDPERDTMDYLKPYVEFFHQDFIGVREEGEGLQALMDQFGAVAEKRQMSDSALNYLIDHTASLFLIGADGRLQAQYLYGTDDADITHDLQIILEA